VSVLSERISDGLPLLVDDDLTLRVGAVLADHHERRQEDRLEPNVIEPAMRVMPSVIRFFASSARSRA